MLSITSVPRDTANSDRRGVALFWRNNVFYTFQTVFQETRSQSMASAFSKFTLRIWLQLLNKFTHNMVSAF